MLEKWFITKREIRRLSFPVICLSIISLFFLLTIPKLALAAAGDGLLSYGSVTASEVGQKYQTWTPSSWGGETSGPVSSVTTNWTALKASPANAGVYVMAMVTTEASNNFKVYSYSGGSWTSEFTATQSSAQYTYRLFDVAFENSSGNVHVVYGKSGGGNLTVYYQEGTWNSGTGNYDWGGEGSFTFNSSYLSAGTNGVSWLVMANRLNSDEMILAAVSDSASGNNISAAIWDGSSFGNQNSTGWGLVYTNANWDFDAAYETASGQGMVAWGFSGTPYWKYATYSGGSWTVNNGATTGITGSIRVLALDADPTATSDDIVAGLTEFSTNDVNGSVWDGSSTWTNSAIDNGINGTVLGRQVDVKYAGTTGNAILVFDDANAGDLSWARSAGGAAFTAQSETAIQGGQDNNIQLVTDANTGKIMFVRLDSNSDIFAYLYTDGSGWAATTSGASLGNALELDSSGGTTKESYMFAYESVFRVDALTITLITIAVAFFIIFMLKKRVLYIKRAEA